MRRRSSALSAPQARGADARPCAAELRNISKRFFGVLANDDAHFNLRAGEVHALLGENGAGKSTLCSVLAGLVRPDSGEVVIDGHACNLRSPRDALARGVGMVYQHFRLVGPFTVGENLILGHPGEPRLLSSTNIQKNARELMERYGMHVDPDALVSDLSVGEQQRTEILKLLYRGVRVLILDEPTAVLTPQETEALFAAMRTLAGEGTAVVFVSHKLNEVLEISDRITVMRDGRVIDTLQSSGSNRSELAAMMLGSRALRNGSAPRTSRSSAAQGAAFEARGLQVRDDRGQLAVRDVSLTVNSGEIVGVAGVSGNGQGELAEAIAGVRPCESGRVYVRGRDLTAASVRRRVGAGLAYVPEDRLQMGVAGGLPLADNLVLRSYRARPYSRAGILRRRAIVAAATELGRRFGVRGARPGTPIRALSGGNIQRAILARELGGDPSVVIAAAPTRGLDIGGIENVHRILRDQCAGGAGVILISEDLDELLELSDRLVVLYEGRLVGELARNELDLERIGLLMAGVEAP